MRRSALVLGLIGAGCAGSGDELIAVDPGPTPGTSSSPISAVVPDGWQAVTAGVGTDGQEWGSDTSGSTEPFTVVERSDDERTLTVSATGFDGYQGGLDQASLGHLGSPVELKVDGRRALLSQGSELSEQDPGLVDLVVDLDGSSAVRAQGVDASRDELIDLASLAIVDTDDHRIAPRFEEVPDGFEVVGSVNATGVLALQTSLSPGSDYVPGDDRTHTLGWTVGPADGSSSDQTTVSIAAIPADTISLAALELALPARASDRSVDQTKVGGRPGLEIAEVSSRRWRRLTLVTETKWGDQLVVTTGSDLVTGSPPPSFEQLTTVAASVERADADTWRDQVEKASGGPGLTANVGRAEVTRGKAGSLEWLLQTGDGLAGGMAPPAIDGCLKLGDGTRACPTSFAGPPDGSDEDMSSLALGVLGPDQLPFAVMAVADDDPAVELRYTTSRATVSAVFHPVDGSTVKVAVLVAGKGDRLDCPGPGNRPGLLERYDADGNPLGC